MRLVCGDFPDAPYQATVHVLTVSQNWKKIAYAVEFTSKGNNALLARVFIEAKTKKTGAVRIGGEKLKTIIAFSYAGQKLGKIISKKCD